MCKEKKVYSSRSGSLKDDTSPFCSLLSRRASFLQHQLGIGGDHASAFKLWPRHKTIAQASEDCNYEIYL